MVVSHGGTRGSWSRCAGRSSSAGSRRSPPPSSSCPGSAAPRRPRSATSSRPTRRPSGRRSGRCSCSDRRSRPTRSRSSATRAASRAPPSRASCARPTRRTGRAASAPPRRCSTCRCRACAGASASTTIVTYLFLAPDLNLDARSRAARAYVATLPPPSAGTTRGISGAGPARLAQWDEIDKALPWMEAATILTILVIVALYFRSVGAPLVTLATAGLGYVVAIRALAWMGERTGNGVPNEIEPVLVVLLLGLVTDYTVFFMAETRRRLRHGATRTEAARWATARVAPLVFAAGTLVIAGALSLLAGKLHFFRVFGPGLAVAALVVTLVCLTLVPALMGAVGPWLFGSRVRKAQAAGPDPVDPPSRARRFVARLPTAKPVAALVVVACVGLLVAAALGARTISLSVSFIPSLPPGSEPRKMADEAAQGFAPGHPRADRAAARVAGHRLAARRVGPAAGALHARAGRRGGARTRADRSRRAGRRRHLARRRRGAPRHRPARRADEPRRPSRRSAASSAGRRSFSGRPGCRAGRRRPTRARPRSRRRPSTRSCATCGASSSSRRSSRSSCWRCSCARSSRRCSCWPGSVLALRRLLRPHVTPAARRARDARRRLLRPARRGGDARGPGQRLQRLHRGAHPRRGAPPELQGRGRRRARAPHPAPSRSPA